MRLIRSTLPLALATVALGATFLASSTAEARPNIKRRGGQWGVLLGGSACIPGTTAKCTRNDASDITVDGKARPSFGLGAELGYRFNKFFFLGAGYNFGFFDADFEIQDVGGTKRAYQNSVFAVFRPTLPVWRFDFGLGLAPGFSRQTFIRDDGNKEYSQGFAWKFGPTIDVFITRRIFLGIKADIIFNGHNRSCFEDSDSIECEKTKDFNGTYSRNPLAPVHQAIFGLHIGGTFL